MKFFHISDLHIGKQLHGYSLIEDQRFILNQILERIDEEKPQALLIAGDIYDKSIPSTDAVELLDGFLTSLSRIQDLEVFLISGNHDSDRRLDFAMLQAWLPIYHSRRLSEEKWRTSTGR